MPQSYYALADIVYLHSMLQPRLIRKIWCAPNVMKQLSNNIEYQETLFNADLIYETETAIAISIAEILNETLESLELTYQILRENEADVNQATIRYLFGDLREAVPKGEGRTAINFLAIMKDTFLILPDNRYDNTPYQEAAKKFQATIQTWDRHLKEFQFNKKFNEKFLLPLTDLNAFHHIWERLADLLEQSAEDNKKQGELQLEINRLVVKLNETKEEKGRHKVEEELKDKQYRLEILEARQPLGTALADFQKFLQCLILKENKFSEQVKNRYICLFYPDINLLPKEKSPSHLKEKRKQFSSLLLCHSDPYGEDKKLPQERGLTRILDKIGQGTAAREYLESIREAYLDLARCLFRGREGQPGYFISYPLSIKDGKLEPLSVESSEVKALVEWIVECAQEYKAYPSIQKLFVGE
jgi:hypothetical protein